MDSIAAAILQHAQSRPQAPAYIDAGETLSYAGLRASMLAAAAWLHRRGARARDIVALALDHEPGSARRSLGIAYGLAYLGCPLLPLYPDVPPATRAELLRRFSARWLVCAGGRSGFLDIELIDALEFDPGAPPEPLPPRGDDAAGPAHFHFTSGTTGDPKACLFTFQQWSQWLLHVSRSMGSSAADRPVSPRPWPEMVGMRSMLRTHLTGGAYVNAAVPQSTAHLARLVRDHGVTELVLSPFQLRVLLKNTAALEPHAAPLRVLCVAGGFVSPFEVEAVRRTITPNFYVHYSTNETGTIALLGPGDSADRPGCVGRILPDIEAQAVDKQHLPLPDGETGLLRFRTPWMPKGYVGNPQASAERFVDGWFYPGDLGSIDAQGWLTLGGRADDVINFGGLKIAPTEVEAVLLQHPDIADAAVVGVPDPMSGQVPVAFLVVRRDIVAGEIQVFCRERMDANRVPFLYEAVNEIPRNAAGKVLRERLREAYARSRG